MNYLLVNRPEITQNELIMKRYSLLVAIIITAVICASSFAQDKASLQPNATVVSLLQGSAGKSVELHLRSGEKMGGKIAQVTDNIVHLSNLTGAEYFDAFVDVKDISAVVVRVSRQIVDAAIHTKGADIDDSNLRARIIGRRARRSGLSTIGALPHTHPMITKNIGMLLLAIYLIAVGILTLTGLGIGIITGVLALLAGIFILIGR